MNKAFTANINDQVTARGYLDENDQLIMLEPEGSGGGDSEFSTATLKIEGFGSNPVELFPYGIAYIDRFSESEYVINVIKSLADGEYTIPLYSAGQTCTIEDDMLGYNVNITGSYDYTEGIITGDLTITGEVV